MRQLITLLFSALIFSIQLPAQNTIEIREVYEYMSQGEQPGLEVFIPEAEIKEVESNLKKYLKKSKAKVKTSRKSVEMFADNARIPEVSDNTVDIYATTAPASGGITVKTFVDLGGAYISSREFPAEYAAFQNFLGAFVLEEQVRVVEEELDDQEDALKDLNKELNSLIKDADKYKKEIEKAKAIIALREADIEEAISSQETKRAQIAIQEEIIQTIIAKKQTLNYR